MKSISVGPIIGALVLGVLFIISLINVFFRGQQSMGELIQKDIKQLVEIFDHINKDCGIIDFDYQKNPINFLNVGSFVGSEVGPMNLKHPERWNGPYLEDNPTMQAIEYQIIYTHEGYFITPGEGVELPNGKVIGEDIILDENANIATMIRDQDFFMFDNQALAAPLYLQTVGELLPLGSP